MICEVCGRPTRVLATREGEHGTVTRRRECTNEHPHRFTTFEIHEAPFRNVAKRVGRYAFGRELRLALRRRDESIISDPRQAREVAAAHGIHPAHVRRIRRMQL
jgi:transcriptional regulator NrdR family protein